MTKAPPNGPSPWIRTITVWPRFRATPRSPDGRGRHRGHGPYGAVICHGANPIVSHHVSHPLVTQTIIQGEANEPILVRAIVLGVQTAWWDVQDRWSTTMSNHPRRVRTCAGEVVISLLMPRVASIRRVLSANGYLSPRVDTPVTRADSGISETRSPTRPEIDACGVAKNSSVLA